MAGTPGRPRRTGDVMGSGGVLATKLFLPRLPTGFVPRQRLVGRLEKGVGGGLSLVSAPAGYGKTVLLAHWCRQMSRPVVWLSLDVADDDPVRFWRHIVAGFTEIRPEMARHVEPLLGSPEPATSDRLVAAMVNVLADLRGDVLLVLDDFHLVKSEIVHTSVRLLLDSAPPGLHVVLAGRTESPFPLGRWRASGQLVELRAADLRFTADESKAMLRQAFGPGQLLPDDAAITVAARAEGWAAGLQLAALSLQGSPDAADAVNSFSGSHRYVVDYLTEEVLERQPASVREFLLETSILDRLSGSLCDAVTGRSDSQAMLESIEQANLFLVPMDDVRGWWRYHHLFAGTLRARVTREQPDRTRYLHREAAAWHESRKQVDDAVGHALAAGDATWAASLIERYFDEFFLGREGATVQRWIGALPTEVAASRARLHLARAALNVVSGRVEDIERSLDAAERTRGQADEDVFEPSVGRSASRLANLDAGLALGRAYTAHLRGDGEATIRYASRAIARLRPDEWMLHGLAQVNLAFAAWIRGEVGEAERAMASNVAHWRAVGQRDLVVYMSSYLGRIQCARGRLDAASSTYRHPLEASSLPAWEDPPAAGVSYVGMAELSYQRGDLDTAMDHLARALPLCRMFVYAQSLAAGLVTLAWIRQARGDAAGAREAMDEAVEFTDPAVTDLFNPVPAQRARLLLAQGDLRAAAEWVASRGIRADDEPRYVYEAGYLVLARILIADDEPGRALELLNRLWADAATQDRTGSVIEIQALKALALAATGNEAAAVDTLGDTVELAWPQGFVRVFADEGAPMAMLLDRLSADRPHRQSNKVPASYRRRLIHAFGVSADRPVTGSGPADRLSPRELEVLRLLASGKPNQAIAEDLFVTLNTVKKHVTHILRKLGAGNRTEATVRARDIGLLP
ncbi:AAA family ATPase [Phytoactinopolyspora alkaliphila]|uniref:AAA family ATPase n=1 Tax=Phytoactinopolyspora alkaliphila TaxID=1783498 RepID=A0A6N9YLE8_9ACTN|nr:LuxR C-terminal-related transcriptional regulator [Phytoactinopolyspora alkaliphila]NED95772.1 AAA family ATPase [Phytoactinopolyspora alkaliphila]